MTSKEKLHCERIDENDVKVIYEDNGNRTETVISVVSLEAFRDFIKEHSSLKDSQK